MHRLCVIVCVCATFVHQKRLPDQLLRCHSKNEIHSCRLTTGIPSWLPLRSRIHGPEQGDPVAGCTSICVTKPRCNSLFTAAMRRIRHRCTRNPQVTTLVQGYLQGYDSYYGLMDQDVRRLNTGNKTPIPRTNIPQWVRQIG